MSIVDNLGIGLNYALSYQSLMYCFAGVSLGIVVGVLPGIGAMAAIAMLLPLTLKLDTPTAMIMLAGIYYGATYGGSTTSILLNVPGTANTAVTAFDGYPMARNGRAGVALFTASIASFFGGMMGILALMLLSPLLARLAFSFGSPEYFALMVLGLLAAALLTSGKPFRAVAMVLLGLILGTVGTDPNSGFVRFSFGINNLDDGFNLLAIVFGIFGMPEIIANAGIVRRGAVTAKDVTWRSMLPTRSEFCRAIMPMLRGTGFGGIMGALPGTGGTAATFIAYATEKRISRTPERFGTGAIEGIAAPEAANNAAVQTAFIPTLTLGIPGDAVMALILATLIVHGIQPGPNLIAENPAMFWGLAVSFVIGNLLLLVLNMPLIGLWVRVLSIPYKYISPIVVVLVCIGVYALSNSAFDVWLLIGFTAVGYGMRLLRCEPGPLLLGLILGPLMEEHLRRALIISRGDPMVFVDRPLSAIFLSLAGLLLLAIALGQFRRRRRIALSRRTSDTV